MSNEILQGALWRGSFMKYAYLITFSWLLSNSSEAAKMTPGQPEGCAFCPAFQHEYLSLFPCVTNKAELPPHSLVNKHRSCRAKGRRGGRRGEEGPRNRHGKNRTMSRAGTGASAWHPQSGRWWQRGKFLESIPQRGAVGLLGKTKHVSQGPSTCVWTKSNPPQIRQTPPFLSFLRTQRRSQRSHPPHPSSVAFLLAGIGPADRCSACPPLTTQRDCASSRRCDAMRCAAPRRFGSWLLTDSRGHCGAGPAGTSACSNTLTHHRTRAPLLWMDWALTL